MLSELPVDDGIKARRHATSGLGDEHATVGLENPDLDEGAAIDSAGVGDEFLHEVAGLRARAQRKEDALNHRWRVAERLDGVGADRPFAALFTVGEASVDDDVRPIHEQRQVTVL